MSTIGFSPHCDTPPKPQSHYDFGHNHVTTAYLQDTNPVPTAGGEAPEIRYVFCFNMDKPQYGFGTNHGTPNPESTIDFGLLCVLPKPPVLKQTAMVLVPLIKINTTCTVTTYVTTNIPSRPQ